MRRFIGIGILIVLLLTGFTGGVFAVDLTTRAFGMGGAFTGVGDDITTIIYNPAGLSHSGVVGLEFNSGFKLPDVSDAQTLLDIPDKMGNDNYDEQDLIQLIPSDLNLGGQLFLGANLTSLGLAVNSYTDMNFMSNKSDNASVRTMVTTEGIVSFSRKLTSPFFKLGEISLGANLKMIHSNESFYQVEATSTQGKITEISADGTGYGLDVGLMTKISPLVTVGAQVRNIWAQNYQVAGTKTYSEYNSSTQEWQQTGTVNYQHEQDPARVMRVGASVYLPVIKTMLAADLDNFPLLTEGDKKMILHLGVEKNLLFNGLSLRAGTFKPAEESRYYTLGLGVNLWKLHLNTAVASNDGFDDNLTAVLSANMKF